MDKPEYTRIIDKIVDEIAELDFVDSVDMKVMSVFPRKFKIDVKLKSVDRLNESSSKISQCIPDYTFVQRFIIDKNIYTIELIYKEE
jgi:hypothetical protein